MRSNILYQSAVDRIEKSGLGEKITEKIKKERYESMPSPYMGHMLDEDYIYAIKKLSERGYFDSIPEEFKYMYQETMNSLLRWPDSKEWKVERSTGTQIIKCEKDDILLFGGFFSSEAMSQEEMWNPKKYGFKNVTDLVASVSEYVRMKLLRTDSSKEGYKWSTAKDGKSYITSIGGSTHGDFRAERTETTPYETIDPFGNFVSLRPKTNEDTQMINAYHSIESYFLMVILKWMDTAGYKSELLNMNGELMQEFLSSFSNDGPFSKKCTENLTGETSFANDAKMVFVSYGLPMRRFNSENRRTHFAISTESRGWYSAYIGDDGELIFSYSNREKEGEEMKKDMVFYKEDVDDILKGIVYQAAMDLGRTSLNEILTAMAYYMENRDKL